ncbi:MAG: tetratricopeptide repeat protein [Bdellovibrionota bacterium]|nr:tetratricopeptide repeat protein [Bdellovibrionota bacterium]
MAEEKEAVETQQDPLTEVLEAFKKQQKLILGAVLVVFGVFGGITAKKSIEAANETEAQSKLFKIEKELQSLKEEQTKQAAVKEAEEKTADVDTKTQMKSLEDQLSSFVSEHKDLKAGVRASLILAKILSEEGQSDKAVEALDMVKTSLGSGALASLYKTQKLSLYLDTEKYDEAVKLADEIIAKKDESFAHPVAYLKKAIAVEKKGEIEEAKAIYKKLSADYPEHSAGKTAKQYLRIL